MSKPLTTQKTVTDIVKEFEQGIIAIPEIQRDVVWDASQIKSLLDSILRGYPCGSIILWEPRERDKTLVKAMIRPERLSNFENRIPRYFLLDGQQRISSLASMLLNREVLRKVLFELEEDMPYLYVNLKNVFRDIEAITEKGAYKFPWVLINDALNNTILMNENYGKLQSKIKQSVAEFVIKITTYTFPTQIIGEVTYEEVAEIFSRVNSQGTQLTGAEIYLAKIVPHWQGITKEFRAYRKKLHDDFSFDIDINFLMKVITAIECKVPQIKKLAALVVSKKIDKRHLDNLWKRIKKAVDMAAKILREDLLLDKSKYIISKNSLVPLVYYINSCKNNVSRKKVSKFFLLSQLSEHYGAASDSTLRNDLRVICNESNVDLGLSELIKQIESETRRDYRGLKVKPSDVCGVSSKNILLLLMYIAMRKKSATDFGLNSPKYLDEIPSANLQLHHIFPVNFMMESSQLKRLQQKFDMNDYEYRQTINDIANLTFTSKEKNASIGDLAPIQYLENETTKDIRRRHFIPANKDLWNPDNFFTFLDGRRVLIAESINRLIRSVR